MQKKQLIIAGVAGFVVGTLIWLSVQNDAETQTEDLQYAQSGNQENPSAWQEALSVPEAVAYRFPETTLLGYPRGLTLEEQNEYRIPELIENVSELVIEHARIQGFPFEGVVISVVEEDGFWIVSHDVIDAYMWASESRPIHPDDPERLHEFQPGDVIRGTIFHGADRYILR